MGGPRAIGSQTLLGPEFHRDRMINWYIEGATWTLLP